MNLWNLRSFPRSSRASLWLGAVILAGWGGALAAAPSLHIGSAGGVPGSVVRLPVLLQSTSPVVAGEFEISHSSPYLDLESAHQGTGASQHRVRSAVPAAGRRRVILYSIVNAPLRDGAIAELTVRILPNAPDVAVSLSVTNVLLVAPDGSALEPATTALGTLRISAARFEPVQVDPSGSVDLELNGRPDGRYVIQFAPTPDAVVWSNLSTNVAIDGVIRIRDPGAAGRSEGFYRAVLAP